MEAFMDTYASFLPCLSAFSLHLNALLERARQDYALAIPQQPSSSDAASIARISSLEGDLRKAQRSLEGCLLDLERANNAAKVVEEGRKAADSALATESSKSIRLQEKLVGANAKISNREGQISQLEISRQLDAAAKFKAEALQRANDQLSAQLRELRQKSAPDLSSQASEMKLRFKRSSIDYINNAFAEAELQAEGLHLNALLERARQDYALAIPQQPSSSDAASIARISSLEGDLRKAQRSLEGCLLDLERANNAAKVVEEGRKAADSALATESSKSIHVDDLRTERDTHLDDLDTAEVDLVESQHSLEESPRELVGANAKISNLEGQISQLEISRQFDAAAKFKAEALQRANDQLSAQLRELRQKSASDLSAQASEMEARFKRSAIDYINNAFAEAELQAEGVTFPRLPYP
ncbi:kinetochore protein nuf2-like [Papaver somniferum]|uniref:kinetochore protein nuf2-like n=1 Tax=Papaver somniferum TaxID=3469 RepID=UPI000E6FFE60|nr:kinetochore protein nuf2-like [Papaver somniferum]